MTATELAAALILLVFFTMFCWVFAARYRARPLVQPTETETVKEFQQRRRRLLRWGVIPFVAAVCATILIAPIPYYPLAREVEPVLGLLVLLSGLATLSLAVLVYRCPVCARIPRGGRFVDLNPEVCAGCGARLK